MRENDGKPENSKENGSAELSTVSEGEEEGEDDMLAQCINIGMQNNRYI